MSKTFMNTPLKNDQLKNSRSTSQADNPLRTEVHALAEAAFHRHLISGHGDSEYPDEYQIVHQGKPKHLSLKDVRAFLIQLLQRSV